MSVTVAVITHDRLKKLEYLLYQISEQTTQPDKVEVYHSGYDDGELNILQNKYPNYNFISQPDKKDWGHDKRAVALQHCTTDWIVTMNDDDQYPFVFLEFMLQAGKTSEADVVYCDFATRTNESFFVNAELERGHITNGCMLINQRVALSIPYSHRTYAGDWFFVEECVRSGVRFHKLDMCLFFAY